MIFPDTKLKRPRLFDPSLGILAITVCLILCFCLFDYTSRLPSQAPRPRIAAEDAGRNRDEHKHEPEHKPQPDFLRGECDVSVGDWLWDDSYPLYSSTSCTFLDQGFRCDQNGRPSYSYTKWRWQPRHCILPRFDARAMLDRMRNKRVVFAGDSIGRNQWESLLCMLSAAVAAPDGVYEAYGNPITKHNGFLVFRFRDCNCTVEYYRAPFLVLQSRPPAGAPPEVKTTLKLDRMDWMSRRWRDADILVLNTGHWWNYEKTARGGCYFQEGSDVKLDMSADVAYRKALDTVFQWVQREVNVTKTHVIFRTFAPVHFRGGDWRSGGACHLETLPDLGLSMVPPHTWAMYNIFAEVAKASSGWMIDVLNISNMTGRRKDGHPSLYYLGPGVVAPLHRQDCSHWCLPGVPDAWNELLYALVLRREAMWEAMVVNSTRFRTPVEVIQ